jgi:ribonuclease Z
VDKALRLGLRPGPTYSKLQRGMKVRIGDREILPEDVLGEKKKGLKVVYSSDTRPCENVVNNSKDAILIHDGTFDESLKENAIETKHSTSVEASVIAREGGAKSLFLTHISPRYKNDDILYEQAKKAFKNVVIAKDLLKVTL